MFGLIVLAGFGVLALWALAYLVWVGRRERLEKREPERLTAEQQIWGTRILFLAGSLDVDDFEAEVERILRRDAR